MPIIAEPFGKLTPYDPNNRVHVGVIRHIVKFQGQGHIHKLRRQDSNLRHRV